MAIHLTQKHLKDMVLAVPGAELINDHTYLGFDRIEIERNGDRLKAIMLYQGERIYTTQSIEIDEDGVYVIDFANPAYIPVEAK
jgi:hypothetical protein